MSNEETTEGQEVALPSGLTAMLCAPVLTCKELMANAPAALNDFFHASLVDSAEDVTDFIESRPAEEFVEFLFFAREIVRESMVCPRLSLTEPLKEDEIAPEHVAREDFWWIFFWSIKQLNADETLTVLSIQ
jgi:hypothetical protein